MAFAAAQERHRPIPGAVATLGVSERVAFLRRTYAHLGVALLAFTVLTALLMRTQFSKDLTVWIWRGGAGNLLLLMVAFMGCGYLAQRLAQSETSRTWQYVGLGLYVALEAIILQPLLWRAVLETRNPAEFYKLITAAAIVTGAIFAGLTLTVFITKKDFSFMRGILMIGSFAALGVIIAALIFGFHLGLIFSGAMILLMAGYVLYETSMVAEHFPPTHHVAAALMLFSTIATMFWYVLRFLMELNRR